MPLADVDIVGGERVGKEAALAPALLFDVGEPLGDRLAVEYRLAGHAPLAEAVDHVVILVRLAEGFERDARLRREEAVVLVGALVDRRARVLRVEEPLFEPMRDRDRVEGQDHLEVEGELRAESDVELVEVSLLQLARLLDPDARDIEDGFELLYVVETCEQDLAAVFEADIHIAAFALGDKGDLVGVVFVGLLLELLKAALAQRLCDLSHHQIAVPRLIRDAL